MTRSVKYIPAAPDYGLEAFETESKAYEFRVLGALGEQCRIEEGFLRVECSRDDVPEVLATFRRMVFALEMAPQSTETPEPK